MYKVTCTKDGVKVKELKEVVEDGRTFIKSHGKQIETELDKVAVVKALKTIPIAGLVARMPVITGVTVFTNTPSLLEHWKECIEEEYYAEVDNLCSDVNEVVRNTYLNDKLNRQGGK